jgi:hypothetical protein
MRLNLPDKLSQHLTQQQFVAVWMESNPIKHFHAKRHLK